MDASFQLLTWFLKFLKIIWKIGSPILFWTGLIWPGVVWFLTTIEITPHPALWVIAWALCFYTLAQRIVRLIFKDPRLNLIKFMLGANAARSEQKALDPAFDKDFYADKPHGYPLGKRRNKWVNLPDTLFYHALITGGSGTGKSSTQVIPFLMKTTLPSLVIDIKKELSEKAKKPGDLIFDPSDPYSCGYNPFGLVTERNLILDIQTISTALIPESAGDNAYWDNEARNLLSGCLLYLYKQNYTFSAAMRKIQVSDMVEFIQEALATNDEDIAVFLGHFRSTPDRTMGNLVSTLSSKIMLFASDPDLIACFSKPDEECIKPQDLLNGHSIYLAIPEARLEVYRGATQLIIGQFCKFFERQPDASGGNPRVNIVLDEFFRLGKLGSIENGLSTLRSKGVRVLLICQSNAQIEKLYDKIGSKVILDNCSVKVLLGATDVETQEWYSKLIGSYERTKKSFSGNKGDFKMLGSSGTSITTEEKRIVRPEQLATLGNEAIVFTPKGWGRVIKKAYYNTPEYNQ